MKNVFKKMFSLFLVGVVAVSMFGFIAPNRVDATEAANAFTESILVETEPSINACTISSTIKFFDESEKVVRVKRAELDGQIGQAMEAKIPKKAKIIEINVMNIEKRKDLRLSRTYKFRRDKVVPSSDPSISIHAVFPTDKDFPKYYNYYAYNWKSIRQTDQFIR